MPWPTMADYQEAIQNPSACFGDPELKTGRPVLNILGLPKPITGAFASVYQVRCSRKQYAVRCFLRYHPDQEQRYAAISSHLQRVRLPYMASFELLKQGIRVRGQWYPILKMEWLNGPTLNTYIEQNLHNPDRLYTLAERFQALMAALTQARIAHGDLQHGNILIVNHELRLIDYDGMFVPSLSGMRSHELGHRNYQPPQRAESDFGLHIDNFSAWVIYLSLRALSLQPALWQDLNAGDECLLLRHEDFLNPAASRAVRALDHIADRDFSALWRTFRTLNGADLRQIPALDSGAPARPSLLGSAGKVVTGWLDRRAPSSADTYDDASVPYAGPDWVLDYIEPAPPPESTAGPQPERITERYVISGYALLLHLILASAINAWITPLAAIILAGMSSAPVAAYVLVQYLLFPEVREKYRLALRHLHLWSRTAALRFRLRRIQRQRERLARSTSDSLGHLDNAVENEIEKQLASIPLTRDVLPDLDLRMIWRLRYYGVHTASDVARERIMRIPRIDDDIANRLIAWRSRTERSVRRQHAAALQNWRVTHRTEILRAFRFQSSALDTREAALTERLDRAETVRQDVQRARADYAHVTLLTYLKWIVRNDDDR